MNAAWGALILTALLCGAGASLAQALQGSGQRVSFGRAWLLGCAALCIALHLPLAVDGRITHRSFALAAAAGLAASVWFLVGCWKRRGTLCWGGWITDLPWAARVCVLAAIGLTASHALRSELSGYDARTAFALKARILYDTGDVTGEDFGDIHRLNFNPTYPLLLPLVEAEMYWCQGDYQPPGLRLLFVGFVLAVASIYAAEIRRFASAPVAAWSACLLLLTPMMIECFEGAGLSGSADLPLCAFVFAGTLELFRFCRQPNWRGSASAGLLLGAAIMTKQEGLIWVAAGGVTALGAVVGSKVVSWGSAARRAIPGVAVLCAAAGLQILAHRSMPMSPYYPSIIAAITDPHWLSQLADRPAQVALYALRELGRTTRWGLLWPCMIAALFLLRRGSVPLETKCWRATTAIVATVYLTTMVVSPLHLQYQLSTTYSRLVLHFFPLAMIVMAEQISASGWMRDLVKESLPGTQPTALPLRAAAAILAVVGPAASVFLAGAAAQLLG